MRSDKNKKTDPNHEIDDFLSKFDDVSDTESESFNSYLDGEESPAKSNQNFRWQDDVKPGRSIGRKIKKDERERAVIKEPAPSSIKVERKRNDSESVHTYPTEDIAVPEENKPEPIEPEKYSEPAAIPEKPKKRWFSFALRKTQETAEPDTAELKDASDISDSDDMSDTSDKSKELEEMFGIASGEASDEDFDIIDELESSESDDVTDDDSKPDEEATEEPEESETDEAETESEDAGDDADTETDSEDAGDDADTDSDEEPEIMNETEDDQESVITEEPIVFDITNAPKSDKTAISTGYIRDPESGEYIKVDPGKRKRIEYRDLPESYLKKTAATLSAAKAEKLSRKEKRAEKKKAKAVYGRRHLGHVLFCRRNKKYNPDEGRTYELNGKKIKNKPYKFSFLKLITDFIIIGILMLIAAVGVGIHVIRNSPEYDYSDIYATVATASVVYDDQGKQIDNIYYTENRRIVNYEDMPESLIEAVVAIEDKTFWKHHGFNWVRMIGAVLSSVTGHGQISGTSTITQQLSRNIYLPEEKSERTIKRKFLEMYYAARLEHANTKEQIIEAYLNTIYLGYGCYGVNSAARTYFSKSVKDLDVVECAALAALPQQPHNYALLKNASDGGELSEDSKVVAKSPDKIVTSDLSKDRRDLTLDLMLEQGLITDAEYKESHGKALNDFINPSFKSVTSNYTYFNEYLIDTIVADLVEQKDMSEEDAERLVYTGGLQIYSTVDTQAQGVIVDEFKDDDNYPGISAIWKQDGDGNILNNDGKIALYDYDDYFDEDDNFTLYGDNDEIVFNSDGSATIKTGHNLYIYETEVNGEKDYSIEFKNYYVLNEGVLYSIQGGYVNIPSTYKSGDGQGNVRISADFFTDDQYKNSFKKDGNNLIIADTGYSIGQQVRQPQSAMVIVEVGTGQVKAMVGGRQFKGQKLLNRAVNSRQPGSSIKPLAVYGAALQKSYELEAEGKKWTYTDFKIDKQGTRGWGDYVTVHSSIEDERTKIKGKYWPKNSTGGFSGTNNFRTAIQQSINTCAVKLLLQVSPEYALAQVRKFGITTAIDEDQDEEVNDVNPAAMALGAMTQGVQPLEMALAYASFPAGGKLNSPICYTKILDREGKVLLEGKSEQTEALNEGVAWIMTDVLKSVVSRGIAYPAAISEVQVGGKTGTTNDQYDIWFDGFTPSYAAALWIGTDNNIEMSTMSYPAAALWGRIMDQIPRAKEGEYKEQPDNVVYYGGDYYTEGTQTGLSSWSYAAEKKKAREAAYKKWTAEREQHRKKVYDDDGKKHEHKTISEKEIAAYQKAGWTVTYEKGKDGKITYHADRDVAMAESERKWHWEYEKGWRDGDFTYKFDGQTFDD